MKIGKVKTTCSKLASQKGICYTHKNLKQELNHGLESTKVHRVTKFNQGPRLKPYIDMNTEVRKKTNNDFKKYFFKLMNNTVFGKTIEITRKHRGIKFVTTETKRNYLVWETNYDTTKCF